MQTIKGIQDGIQKAQARIDAENRAAQTERDKSTEYAKVGDAAGAQAHADAALRYEQNSLQMQGEIADLMDQQQQLQAQLADLDRRKNDVMANKDADIAELDTEIAKLRGGA